MACPYILCECRRAQLINKGDVKHKLELRADPAPRWLFGAVFDAFRDFSGAGRAWRRGPDGLWAPRGARAPPARPFRVARASSP